MAPPFTELAMLPFLQDQRMPQELVNGIIIIGDPFAPHPGALIPDSFLHGPCIRVEFHDYFWVIFNHGPCELSPLPPGNFLLELRVFPLSQLDPSLFEERPTLDCFKAVLVFLTLEAVSVKFYVCLWSHTGSFSRSVLPCPLREKLFLSHFLQRHIHKKLVCMKRTTIISFILSKQEVNQFWVVYVFSLIASVTMQITKQITYQCVLLFFLKKHSTAT